MTNQLDELQSALCSAKHATEGLRLQPLVLQLQGAADSLRAQKTPDDAALAEDLASRLENAAGSLSKARPRRWPAPQRGGGCTTHALPPGAWTSMLPAGLTRGRCCVGPCVVAERLACLRIACA